MQKNPKVSIITVVWNNKETISDAINSVLGQKYKNIEYIIVDGASSDGTVEVVESYGDKITKFISEPDKGLYDAMNKGIELATGNIIGILNSDDFYIDEFVIEKIVKEFEVNNVDCVYADLLYVQSNNPSHIVRYYDSSVGHVNNFQYALYPAHPTFFVCSWVYEKYGSYKTDYKISSDFDVMARFLYTHKIKSSYIASPLIKMRLGGVSTSLSSFWYNNLEQLRVCKENKIKTNIFKIFLKYPIKLWGIINK